METDSDKLSKCPKCGETDKLHRLPNDPGEDGDFLQCQCCDYIYENGWEHYEFLR